MNISLSAVYNNGLVLVLWCLMPLSTIFQLYCVSVLLMGETRGPGENHRSVTSHSLTDKLYHIMLYTLPWLRFDLTTSVVIHVGTDCTGSCKSNYHTITPTTAPKIFGCNCKIQLEQLDPEHAHGVKQDFYIYIFWYFSLICIFITFV